MEQKRAWATLEIKSFDDATRTFEGIASTPETDRQGDIVEPKGAEFTLPIPFLWQHDADLPIGQITAAKVTSNGITVKGYVENLSEPPSLKNDLDRAWAMMKSKLVRGLSIGFQPLDFEQIKDSFGLRFTRWSWLELSAVTIPANASATIQQVKSFDEAQQRAAPGTARNVQSPGDSGRSKGSKVKPITEQIASYEAKRAADVARMGEIMDKSCEDGATLEAEQKSEYDSLTAEIKEIDEHLVRLKAHEVAMKATATPVDQTAGKDPDKGSQARQGRVQMGGHNLPKGIGMARYVKALAFAKGNNQAAQEYAKQWDDSTPEVTMALKAAVAAGTTQDSAWAGPLVYNQNLASEFVEYLRPQTILGKMTGFRHVPFNVRFPTQTAGSTVGWVGEGLAKPVSKLQFSSGTLGFAKAAGIVVITQELARFSSPSAELLVRNDLTAQMVYFLDQQFIDPSVSAVANVNPASILNGASNVRQAAAAWTTMANVIADVKALLLTFTAQEVPVDGSMYWIMTPDVALSLSMIPTAGGENFAFPTLGLNGGSFLGIPVIITNSIPHSTSAGSIVALVKASEIFLADEGGIAIDVSEQASLQMDSAPTESSAAPTASTVVSLWQTNSIGIRCERIINWARRRNYGVGYIDNVHIS